MFNFGKRSVPRYLTIRETLAKAGVTSAADPARLTVLEKMGSYSGRRVNFFRAFDPQGGARALQVHEFRDLDGHLDLLLASGHVEHEGLVMLDGHPEAAQPSPAREPANRAVHTDDERFVFQP